MFINSFYQPPSSFTILRLFHRTSNSFGALCDLVPFVQFKKHEKHPWRSVNFSDAYNFTKINTPPWVFFTFLKLYKRHQIAHRIIYVKS